MEKKAATFDKLTSGKTSITYTAELQSFLTDSETSFITSTEPLQAPTGRQCTERERQDRGLGQNNATSGQSQGQS
jgi:hypothetical protein